MVPFDRARRRGHRGALTPPRRATPRGGEAERTRAGAWAATWSSPRPADGPGDPPGCGAGFATHAGQGARRGNVSPSGFVLQSALLPNTHEHARSTPHNTGRTDTGVTLGFGAPQELGGAARTRSTIRRFPTLVRAAHGGRGTTGPGGAFIIYINAAGRRRCFTFPLFCFYAGTAHPGWPFSGQ